MYPSLPTRWQQLAVAAIAAAAIGVAASAGGLTSSGVAKTPPPPPETTVTGPSGFVNDREVAFRLASDQSEATFECRMDGSEWTGCGEVWYAGLLLDGPHVFEGRAVNATGSVDPTPARLEFVLDREKPSVLVRNGWEPTAWTSNPQPTFHFSAAEPVTFACAFDGAALGPCDGPDWDRPASPLALGMHEFRVVATDRAGNVASGGSHFSIVPPPIRPRVSVGKPRLLLSSGRAMLPVKVNRVGGLRLLSKSAKAVARGAKSAGTVWLPVVPVGKAAKALAAEGKAKVGVLVRFRTFDGTVEKRATLTLRKQT